MYRTNCFWIGIVHLKHNKSTVVICCYFLSFSFSSSHPQPNVFQSQLHFELGINCKSFVHTPTKMFFYRKKLLGNAKSTSSDRHKLIQTEKHKVSVLSCLRHCWSQRKTIQEKFLSSKFISIKFKNIYLYIER